MLTRPIRPNGVAAFFLLADANGPSKKAKYIEMLFARAVLEPVHGWKETGRLREPAVSRSRAIHALIVSPLVGQTDPTNQEVM